MDFPTDLSDPRRLAGYASQISVVTVKSIRPGEERFGTPWTIADVRIELSLKGNQQGTISVLQQGGKRQSTGTAVRIGGDTPLVQGKSYLLSTTGTPGSNQTVIPVYGIKPLTTSDLEKLKTTGDTPADEVSDMRRAVTHQIPFTR
ncbi:hypothetical protein [Mycolicibacterium nivoides]|uniref:hypothetical protein n=1 Tax=Mycolicibacterium nivoides TaxID=2487344 RepID=UPI003C2D632F